MPTLLSEGSLGTLEKDLEHGCRMIHAKYLSFGLEDMFQLLGIFVVSTTGYFEVLINYLGI